MSLIIWIATFIFALPDLFLFKDDVFSFDLQTNSSWYSPYHKLMPAKQVALLSLWGDLRIPHEECKQIFGSSITIIGFVVDTNHMTIFLASDQKNELIQSINDFLNPVIHTQTLQEYQSLMGWINWTAGKSHPSTPLWINKSIQGDLLWFLNHISHSPATLHIKKSHWSLSSAFIIYVDACPTSLGIWMPALNCGFTSQVDFSPPSSNIFFLESLTVASAVHIVSSLVPHGTSILIWSNSFNTIALFNSLHATSA
ncbi:hypothetical protein BDQ17DRAFT_1434523 [Cyathus striatus]|nr:hypothetical protein BDQ17DRAFT_1434523 [Cyathus striatus]